jgi:hypothetical protein
MKNTLNNNVWKFASIGSQFMVGIGIFVFLGIKIDNWLQWQTPIATWLLPLLFIISSIIKLIIETNKKNNQK